MDEEDFDYLCKLDAMQKALAMNVTDPVVIRTPQEGADFMCLGQYYDTCENEELARKTIENRVRNFRRLIVANLKMHQQCVADFREIDRLLLGGDRYGLVLAASNILQELGMHGSRILESRRKLDHFSYYPKCPSGHYFHMIGAEFMGVQRFNEEETYRGLNREISCLEGAGEDFQARFGPLPPVTNIFPGSSGFFDKAYENNLETTLQLLKQVDIVLA